ncbi:tRNA-2-methylthio-N6-dimethylallyladenosine synthase [Acetoanaerobium pronyense]|uniref:tRNA-2-methylthio-N(6)-dimethylallyladenosine synthase n=1 Tax=Acetoanaerobium pronyense TaxID=1482736 RepID=A0ABS4KH00_9FIRM|nr:tRNA-2-methylthio-N6-dimethylallyladenosine synthase [Acetoanaerobium pronyense]
MSERKSIKVKHEEILRQQQFINELRTLLSEDETKYKKYYIVTWGCQMNEHDSENLTGMFDLMGLTPGENEEDADIIIYNTCAVRENAELKVYGNLSHLKKIKKIKEHLVIAVCGCMMQQSHIVDEIKKKYPHVSLVFGTHNLYKFPELLTNFLSSNQGTLIDVWDIDGRIVEGLPTYRKKEVKSFVNIMYGCNNFCSYCIVPYTRGRERSREPKDIVTEVESLVKDGVKEITLLGQNVNSYGNTFEQSYTFADLLKTLNDVDGIKRIRFMTSHPKDISDDVIDAIANLPKVCESIHLPVQAGSTRVLKAMNRNYTKEDYLSLIKKIKSKIKDVALTTDIMVGFPGESEEDFLDTLDLINEVRYDSAFMFIYSVRKGTVAENMENHIEESVKKERFHRLLEKTNEIAREINASYKDKVVEVLVEGKSKKDPNILTGRTRQNKLVNFKGDESLIGDIINIKVTDPKSFSLNGIVL